MTDIDHAAILRQHADTRRRGHSVNPEVLRAAADEIEGLREELTASHESHGNEVGALTERLALAIHERDEARREVCVAREAMIRLMIYGDVAVPQEAMHQAAKARGWDCFKEDGKPCQ